MSSGQLLVYSQTWSADNRLIGVTKALTSGAVLAQTSYFYDGDGARVRKVPPRACRGDDPDGTTLYAGPVEQTIGPGGTATAEYFDDISGTSTLTAFVATRNETVTAGFQQTFTVPPAGLGSEPWGVRYQIWLMVPTTDTYRLAVYADDGFLLSGQGLSLSNATTRDVTATEASTVLTLTPGAIYNFALTYLNYTSATTSALQLLWRKGSGALEVVPKESIRARGRRDYYSFGGAVVAMKEGVMASVTRTLSYLHGDHLGSASLTTNVAGQKVSEQRYKPYGEVRWSSGAGMPTDRQFTSQTRLTEGYVGTLYDYVARAYDPVLGRFISADTIVPGAENGQSFNRYSYVRNAPLQYSDPSGHMETCGDSNLCEGAMDSTYFQHLSDFWATNAGNYGWQEGSWNTVAEGYSRIMLSYVALADGNSKAAEAYRTAGLASLTRADLWTQSHGDSFESYMYRANTTAPEVMAYSYMDAAGAGAMAAYQSTEAAFNLLGEVLGPQPCSFSPDTPVVTEEGLIPISGVITGTRVLAWDEMANTTGYYPVTNVWVHWDPVLIVLVVNGETITTTPEHPFYTPMHGWLPAGMLWVGVGLRRADGAAGLLEATRTVTRTEKLWDLTVGSRHSFFVGKQRWLVHNCGGSETDIVYRSGAPSPSNLRPRPKDNGLMSGRDSLSNPWPTKPGDRPVFTPGDDWFALSVQKLPSGSVFPDGIPPGHVSIADVGVDVLKNAIIERGKFPR